MGWSTGSLLFTDLIGILQEEVKDEKLREVLYGAMIEAFESYDCDNLDECVGDDPSFDLVWESKYPSDSYSEEYDDDYVYDDEELDD